MLLKNGKAVDDIWAHAPDEAELSPGGCVTVSLGRFLSEFDMLTARNEAIGVRLAPADDPHLLAPHLDRVRLIEVAFPRYTDGRGYSQAQLLRRRLGYTGDMRAVGHVLRDQLGYMARAGFDEVALQHPDLDAAAAEAIYRDATSEFSEVYQATADGRATVFEKRHAASQPAGANGEGDDREAAARVAQLNAELRSASAHDIIHAAKREFGDGLTYVSSFGAESAAMLALIADVDPAMPIIFIDTGMHFQQTLDYRDTLSAALGLTGVRTVRPVAAEVTALDPKGTLNKSDPDACCEVRKVRPLEPALEGFTAWITGRKRFHGGGRMALPVVEWSEGRFKVNPLASWGQADVDALFAKRNLPRHPLVAEGYPSIGCWPCTVQPADPSDVRSGRWVGRDKSECGLHLERKDRPRVF